jgi:predicted dithiol-disulfide oxidoreductase (DUF899 family)
MPNAVEKELEAANKEYWKIMEKMARLRRKLPRKAVDDATFTNTAGKKVKLSQLFGKHDHLILVHHMGPQCPYCTLWADGYSGQTYFVEKRAAFVVAAPKPPKVLAEAQKKRGWKFAFVSDEDGRFAKDMGFWSKPGDKWEGPWPGVSVFERKGGRIERISKDMFGPGDQYCPAFHFFDLLPEDKKK